MSSRLSAFLVTMLVVSLLVGLAAPASAASAAPADTFALDGNPRVPAAQEPMGAYESRPVFFVDQAATTGAKNGSSWENAFTDLQAALTAAKAAVGGAEIWVASGTYSPGGLRISAFEMQNDLGIYGGFAGTESLRSERDWVKNVTTLSGSRFNYNVVRNESNGLNASAVLDGFTITGGNANNYYDSGGGLYNYGASPTITNVIFTGNSAISGGGMLNVDGRPTLTNVTFRGNTASQGGGGLYNNSGSPTLINVTFTGNSAGWGGAMYTYFNSNPILINATITGNTGGIAAEDTGSLTLRNSILWGNSGEQISIYGTNVNFSHSLVQGCLVDNTWKAACGHSDGTNIDADPLFLNGSSSPRLGFFSPARNTGDLTQLPADTFDLNGDGDTTEQIPFDRDGSPRVFGAQVDMGAYETQLVIGEGPGPALYDALEDYLLTVQLHAEASTVWTKLGSTSHGAATVDSSTGMVSYTPDTDYIGPDSLTVQAALAGQTATLTLNLTVTPVNDAPSFSGGSSVTVFENSGLYTGPTPWASGFNPGPANESAQTLQQYNLSLPPGADALFATPPAIDPLTGVLTFQLAPDANTAPGGVQIQVTAQDDGGTDFGGVDQSAAQPLTLIITPVNSAPSFTSGGTVTVLENSPAYTSPTPWATGFTPGPADESGQTALKYHLSLPPGADTLFVHPPAINPLTGILTFELAPDVNTGPSGVNIQVTVQDNGGIANGGVDQSAAQTLTLIITPVNSAPSFSGSSNPVTVLENSTAYTGLTPWATSFNPGPTNESGQTVLKYNLSLPSGADALFATPPAIDPLTGVLTFELAPDANTLPGGVNIQVTVQDNGGTANGGVDQSTPQPLTLIITPVNSAPFFTSGGSVTVEKNSPAYTSPTPWARPVSAGAQDEQPGGANAQTVTFVVDGNTNPSLFAIQPSLAPDGSLSFTPKANAMGRAEITVYLRDNGGTANNGVDQSAKVTFTIKVAINGIYTEQLFVPVIIR